MTEKNETEDGNSISFKSPWHMKWDRQQFLPFFPVAEIGSIMHLLYFSYPQEIWAQFVEWGKKVLSPYSPQWSVYFSISLLQIAGKHPVIYEIHWTFCLMHVAKVEPASISLAYHHQYLIPQTAPSPVIICDCPTWVWLREDQRQRLLCIPGLLHSDLASGITDHMSTVELSAMSQYSEADFHNRQN